MDALECYLVGGAVRDELRGEPVTERDWVVVGSSTQQMLDLGFVQVGKDFPVFLHPQTHEEYALARTERKHSIGHTGFSVNATPAVTLVEDLQRRDLTINAIAKSAAGEIIDPYGGLADLQQGLLRHVSPAFAEDPLRVMRVARFAAQLPGFVVAEETLTLMSRLCHSAEMSALSAERVWAEFNKALGYTEAANFVAVLSQCGGLTPWFIELRGRKISFARRDLSAIQRFALLALPAGDLQQLAERLKTPKEFVQRASDFSRFAPLAGRWRQLDPAQLCDMLVALKVVHDLKRIRDLIDLLVLSGGEQLHELLAIAAQLKTVHAEVKLPGAAYGAALREARVAWLAQQLAVPLA